MTAAEHATNYALNRVVDDPDFRWHMLHTQTLRLLIIAEAERKGVEESEVERDLMAAIEKSAANQREAELPAIRRRLHEVEAKAYYTENGTPPTPQKRQDPSPLEYLEATSR